MKVVIADDERLICEMLVKIINWDELGLEFVGYVHNGEKLYEKIIEDNPDIIITDINMPGLNGLDLIKRIRSQSIASKVIIVSGYQQFDFAHSAIKYNVDDYILKPVNKNEINASLKKIVDDYRKSDNNELKAESYNNAKKADLFFQDLIFDKLDINDLDEISLNQYDLDLTKGNFQGFVIKLDILNKNDNLINNTWTLINKFNTIINDVFKKETFYIMTYKEKNKIFGTISFLIEKKELILRMFHELFENIRQYSNIFSGVKVTIALGEVKSEATLIVESYKEAMIAMHSRLCVGIDMVIRYEYKKDELANTKFNEISKKMKSAATTLNIDEMKKNIQELRDLKIKGNEVKILIDEINIIQGFILKEHKKVLDILGKYTYFKNEVYYNIDKAYTLKDLIVSVGSILIDQIKEIKEYIIEKNALPVRNAIEYIHENYDKELNLESIANHIGLSSVYLSQIFKKSIGENFTNYVNNYRLEKAKELLVNTSLSITEIALKIGINDQKYFSKQFKKNIGIHPSEYRKIFS